MSETYDAAVEIREAIKLLASEINERLDRQNDILEEISSALRAFERNATRYVR